MIATRRAALAAPMAALTAPGTVRAQQGVVTGTVAYRERMALPPGAVLEVQLVDISREGGSWPVIAAARIEVAGQVPIPFEIRYDPSRIDPRATLAVSARLSFGGRVQFAHDRLQRVLTQGAGTTAEIDLVRVVDLLGTWVAEEIAGEALAGPPRPDITFTDEGRVHGSGGCNRFTGGYEQRGPRLQFGALAQTNIACAPDAMAREARFHAALAAVRAWRVDDGRVLLIDGRGEAAMRLSRAP